jgi:hypothetical protein
MVAIDPVWKTRLLLALDGIDPTLHDAPLIETWARSLPAT